MPYYISGVVLSRNPTEQGVCPVAAGRLGRGVAMEVRSRLLSAKNRVTVLEMPQPTSRLRAPDALVNGVAKRSRMTGKRRRV